MRSIPTLCASSFPLSQGELEEIGLKLSPGGAHISRTMMLSEITKLLSETRPETTEMEYRQAVIASNLLSKSTATTREKTFRHLREFYLLSHVSPLFRIYRYLADYDPASLQQLSLLVAWSRDPLLRASTSAIFRANIGSEVSKDLLKEAITQEYQTRYSDLNIDKIARNAGSSWTQSGHLSGRSKKFRKMINATPAALTLALYIGHLSGLAGEQLLRAPWVQLLDLSIDQARTRAAQLNSERLINLRAIGSVVEITFPKLDKIVGWNT